MAHVPIADQVVVEPPALFAKVERGQPVAKALAHRAYRSVSFQAGPAVDLHVLDGVAQLVEDNARVLAVVDAPVAEREGPTAGEILGIVFQAPVGIDQERAAPSEQIAPSQA